MGKFLGFFFGQLLGWLLEATFLISSWGLLWLLPFCLSLESVESFPVLIE